MDDLESFRVIARRYCVDPEEMPIVTIVSLSECLRTGFDPQKVLAYVTGCLSIVVRQPQDLLQINQKQDEEELACFPCAEGVVLSHASEGWWLVFTP